MSKYFVITWRHTNTGVTGNGRVTSNKAVAEQWVKEMNKKYPAIHHRITELNYLPEQIKKGDRT